MLPPQAKSRTKTLCHRRLFMLTFFIIIAVMAVVLLLDFRPLIKGGRPAVIVFYSVLTALSLIILTLDSFGVELPSIYGF